MRACPPMNPDEGECGHGVAADGPEAAALALNSGVDSEMTSTLIRDFGAQLLAERRISMRRLNDAVRRILRVKFRAGLFENPYSPFTPEEAEARDAEARRRRGRPQGRRPLDGAAARTRARCCRSTRRRTTAVIGPLADNQHDMLGPWWGRGDDEDVVTVLDGIDEQNTGTTTYAEGCKLSNLEVPQWNGRRLRLRRPTSPRP